MKKDENPAVLEVISWVRYPLMTQNEFEEIANNHDLFTPKQIISIIRVINNPYYEIENFEFNRKPREMYVKAPEPFIAKIHKDSILPDELKQSEKCEIIFNTDKSTTVLGLWVLVNFCGVIDSSIQIMTMEIYRIDANKKEELLTECMKILEKSSIHQSYTKMKYFFDYPVPVFAKYSYRVCVKFPRPNVGVCSSNYANELVKCFDEKLISNAVCFNVQITKSYSSILGILYR